MTTGLAAPPWAAPLGEGRRALLLLALFVLSWTLLEGVVGAQFQRPYHLMQIVWCRYAVHLACLLLVCGWRGPSRLWRTRRPVFQLLRSLCMLVMPLSFALALAGGVGGHTVWALFWVAPLLILALARGWLRESVPPLAWVAAALGALAAVLLLQPHWPAAPGRLAWPLAMAASFALYVAMTRQLREETVQANLFYTAAGVFALLTPLMPWVWVTPSAHDALVLAGIGVVGLLGLWALDRACEAAPVSLAAPVLVLHLAGMFGIDALARGIGPSRGQWLALLLIGAAVLLAWRVSAGPRGAPGTSP